MHIEFATSCILVDRIDDYALISELNKNKNIVILDNRYCSLSSNDVFKIFKQQEDVDILSLSYIKGVFNELRSCTLGWWFLEPEEHAESHYGWKINPACTLIKKGSIEKAGGFFLDYASPIAIYADLAFRIMRSGGIVKIIDKITLSEKSEDVLRGTPQKDALVFVQKNLSWQNLFFFIIAHFGQLFSFPSFKLDTSRLNITSMINSEKKKRCINDYSTIIPTLCRYDYLDKAINSLLNNSRPPKEIIVVDQTPINQRKEGFYAQFPFDIVKVFFLETPGQATARNLAVAHCSCDWILFFDDDSEAWSEMIEEHIDLLERTYADVSTGISLAPWKNRSYIHESISYVKVSDVLDTGNAMILKNSFEKVGRLDVAFDKGSGVDDNLGRRLYKNGFLILFNPKAIRTHYKAPMGGLREHGAWWAGKSQWWRELPLATHTYNIMCFYEKRYWFNLLLYSYVKSIKRNTFRANLLNFLLAPYKLVKSFLEGRKILRKYRSKDITSIN